MKDAISVADRLRDAELKQKLATVQMECANLAEENARLRHDLLALREQTQVRQDMAYQDNVYWRRLAGKQPDGPFCPKCLDGSDKVARMTVEHEDHCWRCHVCGNAVIKPGQGSRQSVVDDDWPS
jgi:hypothetical protein